MKRLLTALAFLAAAAAPAVAGTVRYYHTDALGSVRAVTDQAGNVVERHDYLPFGGEWNPQGGEQPRRFAGKERDGETGLDYLGARYYASPTARFTSVDPVFTFGENFVDPQRWNRYHYARNNPLRYTDPDGRIIETPWDALNVALGVASLGTNIAAGNVGSAALDAAGLIYDAAATVVPGLPAGAGTALKAARAADKAADAVRVVDRAADAVRAGDGAADAGKTYLTYVVRQDGHVVYVGRTSGRGPQDAVLARRISNHRLKGQGDFAVVDVQRSRAANRGAEEVIFQQERFRAAQEGRTLLNRIEPVSSRNRKLDTYLEAYISDQ